MRNEQQASVFAFQIAIVADATLAIFLCTVVVAALPPQLLNPAWAAAFVQSLLDNGVTALVAVALLLLASYLDPANPQLNAHRRFCCHLCCYVVFGYLLLIPLQGYSAYRLLSQARQQDVLQFDATARRISRFAKEVEAARTYDQLSSVLRANQGVSIAATDRQRPLAQTKAMLRLKIQQAQTMVAQSRRADQLSGKAFVQLQLTLRNWILCLGYAIGFAALAQFPRSQGPLLQELFAAVMDRLENGLQRRQQQLQKREQQQLEQRSAAPLQPAEPAISAEALQRLRQQGIVDERWFEASPAADCEPARAPGVGIGAAAGDDDPFGQPPLQPAAAAGEPPGWLARVFSLWRSAPRQDPGAYFEQLAEAADPSAGSENAGSENAGSTAAERPLSPLDRPDAASAPPPRRSGFADRDYFDRLAQEQEASRPQRQELPNPQAEPQGQPLSSEPADKN